MRHVCLSYGSITSACMRVYKSWKSDLKVVAACLAFSIDRPTYGGKFGNNLKILKEIYCQISFNCSSWFTTLSDPCSGCIV